MVVQIKPGKRENGKSFWDNLYRKRSTSPVEIPDATLKPTFQETAMSASCGPCLLFRFDPDEHL